MSQNTWITVDSFFLDETEVTAAAYAACVHAGRCDAQDVTSTTGSGTSLVPNAACNYGVAGRQDHPMNCVDWQEADAYCRARGTRLPTNDEWEWAARSAAVLEKIPIDKQGSSPWDGADSAFQPCWSARDRRTGTCVVGSNPAGDPPVGPKDLAGNVSEWTAAHQRRAGSTSPASTDSVPVAPDLELMWGGSWENNGPSSYHPFPKVYRFASTGFRCAK